MRNKAKLGRVGVSGATSPESGICETNPIPPPGPGGTGPGGRGAWGFVQTNPILARCVAATPPPFQYSTIPLFQSDANRAKRSQFRGVRLGPEGETCETNPSLGELGYLGQRRRKVECAKQTQFPRRGRVGQGLGDAERGLLYKQTQFRPGAWPRHRHHSSSPSSHHSSPMPIVRNEPNLAASRAKQTQFGGARPGPQGAIVQNEPNSENGPAETGGRLCETKPNLGGLGYLEKGRPSYMGDFAGKWNVRNEPNSRCRRVGQGLGDEGQLCKTNPICPVRRGRGGRNMQNEPNSGPAHGRDTLPFQYAIGPAFQSDVYRIKQSQSPTVPGFDWSWPRLRAIMAACRRAFHDRN
jgi:hypothetical protein